jgi:DNA sulfur modification protein DndC
LNDDPLLNAIDVTTEALEQNSASRWIVGFSGGKDSTAALKILLSACGRIKCAPPNIDIIYCDTGVENPVLDRYVKSFFGRLKDELGQHLPFVSTKILQAPVEQRFFVKIVGRGYPPPTNNFRWCTNFLRIRPVAEFVKQAAVDDAIVVLGMRRSESQQRDRSLASSDGHFQDQREGNRSYRLFLPILDLDVPAVWDAVFSLTRPKSVNAQELESLYRGASGECPVIKAPQAAPCASGRFGCWTCTVVRKDKSALSLIDAGHSDLVPFHDFRNWLAEVRNDPRRRWKRRRNGSHGAGAFNLRARREIFDRLKALERQTRTTIIAADEVAEIERLWELDREIDAEMDEAA